MTAVRKMPEFKLPRPTELQCQATIVQAATATGWRVHAERAAQTQSGRWSTPVQGHRGFPDLVLARGDLLVVIELKRKPNTVEPEQIVWHEAFRAAGVLCGVVWVPDQLDELLDVLAAPASAPIRSRLALVLR